MKTTSAPSESRDPLTAAAAAIWPGAYVRLAFGRDFVLHRPGLARVNLGRGTDAALKRLRELRKEARG